MVTYFLKSNLQIAKVSNHFSMYDVEIEILYFGPILNSLLIFPLFNQFYLRNKDNEINTFVILVLFTCM